MERCRSVQVRCGDGGSHWCRPPQVTARGHAPRAVCPAAAVTAHMAAICGQRLLVGVDGLDAGASAGLGAMAPMLRRSRAASRRNIQPSALRCARTGSCQVLQLYMPSTLRSHLIWLPRYSWWGSLTGWCRTNCGSCSNGWCRRLLGLRTVDVAGMATVRCWLRSCSWPRRAARGSSCPLRRSVSRGRRLTAVLPSGRRPGCGPSSTVWSSTSSAPAASWTGPAARSTR